MARMIAMFRSMAWALPGPIDAPCPPACHDVLLTHRKPQVASTKTYGRELLELFSLGVGKDEDF